MPEATPEEEKTLSITYLFFTTDVEGLIFFKRFKGTPMCCSFLIF